jgi:hypothetical protein
MRPQRPKPVPTPASIKEGLARIDSSIEKLTKEVEALKAHIRPSRRPVKNTYVGETGYDSGSDWKGEPRRAISDIVRKLPDDPSIELQAACIKAILDDLYGALTDIRATRNLVNAISDDSDLRKEFKARLT